MNPKEHNKDSDNKEKKSLRETNSYKIKFKNRKRKKSNQNNLNNHNNYNCIYSRSNYSAKTFNQKPKSNKRKNNKDLNFQSINNFSEAEKNAISYSNFGNSDINVIMKGEKNKIKNFHDFGLIKRNEDGDFEQNEIKNLKMNVKELSESQRTIIEDNNINYVEEKPKNFNEIKAVKYNDINKMKKLTSENKDNSEKLSSVIISSMKSPK